MLDHTRKELHFLQFILDEKKVLNRWD